MGYSPYGAGSSARVVNGWSTGKDIYWLLWTEPEIIIFRAETERTGKGRRVSKTVYSYFL
jgi:hypothetical protein